MKIQIVMLPITIHVVQMLKQDAVEDTITDSTAMVMDVVQIMEVSVDVVFHVDLVHAEMVLVVDHVVMVLDVDHVETDLAVDDMEHQLENYTKEWVTTLVKEVVVDNLIQ
jgi:hypothetical protein